MTHAQGNEIELIFLGTGTSAGVPMIGCHCDVCRSTNPRDKRYRASVVFRYGGKNILVDTTPELRLSCVANQIDVIEAVVFTHAHADHIMGLDDIRRFNTTGGKPIDAYADEPTHRSIERCFGYAFTSASEGTNVYRPQLIRRTIDGPFDVCGVTWTPIKLFHGKQQILGFRVGNVAYCTDVSHIPEESFPLLMGLDLLVLDALRWSKHSTHFSVEQALEASARIGAKQTVFTHIAHDLAHDETNAKLPNGVRLAFDGERISVPASSMRLGI